MRAAVMPYIISSSPIDLPFPISQLRPQCLDLDENGKWLAVIESEDGFRLKSETIDVGLKLPLNYAIVRGFGDRAVIMNARMPQAEQVNAWVVDLESGDIVSAFSVGDGLEDVVITDDFIVVSYFDEGVFSSHDSPSKEGIAVFDHFGVYQWGYMSGVVDPVEIYDCYAMCKIKGNQIAFCAYPDFLWVELDLVTRQQVIIQSPEKLHGASAITMLPDAISFYAPYPDIDEVRTRVYAMKKDQQNIIDMGSIPGEWARGLPNGCILSGTSTEVFVNRFHD